MRGRCGMKYRYVELCVGKDEALKYCVRFLFCFVVLFARFFIHGLAARLVDLVGLYTHRFDECLLCISLLSLKSLLLNVSIHTKMAPRERNILAQASPQESIESKASIQ
jgi:hypothetical protein